MKIVVLAGGLSPERNVSRSTGAKVCAALRERGHQAALVDLFFGLEDYEGSLEIDPELLAEAEILPYEKILVSNRSNGARLETYAIPGEPGKRRFCLNGPAAKLGDPGDIVTIMAFSIVEADEAKHWLPRVIVLDEHNEIKLRKGGTNL